MTGMDKRFYRLIYLIQFCSFCKIEVFIEKLNFSFKSQIESHGKFKNLAGKIVILPMNKKEIPIGTFNSILKQLEIDEKVFEDLLG